jgi:hypothetical protein
MIVFHRYRNHSTNRDHSIPGAHPALAAGRRFAEKDGMFVNAGRKSCDHATAACSPFMKASRSAFTWSLCVEHIPCGAPG